MRLLRHVVFYFHRKKWNCFPRKNVFSWVNILLDTYFVRSTVIETAWRNWKEKLFLFLISNTSYKLVKLGFFLVDGGKVNWRELWQINRDSHSLLHTSYPHTSSKVIHYVLKSGFYRQDCLSLLGPNSASLITSEIQTWYWKKSMNVVPCSYGLEIKKNRQTTKLS